ncbi:unnamed protein product [Spirodela intermedia]|uniref:Uncharacterized protein n=1 Tax=Spirodela intermedia TaxID=51605 RepID=A0A7I8L020_SPIIN|nr:unnamed protein product [Spirodela intermedia]
MDAYGQQLEKYHTSREIGSALEEFIPIEHARHENLATAKNVSLEKTSWMTSAYDDSAPPLSRPESEEYNWRITESSTWMSVNEKALFPVREDAELSNHSNNVALMF